MNKILHLYTAPQHVDPWHAAWRRSYYILWCWMDMQQMNAPVLGYLGVLVGGGQGLGQGLSVRKLSAGLV